MMQDFASTLEQEHKGQIPSNNYVIDIIQCEAYAFSARDVRVSTTNPVTRMSHC